MYEMKQILQKEFFQQSALDIAKNFLGKTLVHSTPEGRISGIITDIEAYPAGIDKVSHGNKKTKRTEVMYREGGYAYVYLIYGIHHQFAVVVNKKDIPEVVFIRAVQLVEGIDLMRKNFGKPLKQDRDLTKSPGNLCKSFGITLDLYGESIPGKNLWLEDTGILIDPDEIKSSERVGINEKLEGSQAKYRYYVTKL